MGRFDCIERRTAAELAHDPPLIAAWPSGARSAMGLNLMRGRKILLIRSRRPLPSVVSFGWYPAPVAHLDTYRTRDA